MLPTDAKEGAQLASIRFERQIQAKSKASNIMPKFITALDGNVPKDDCRKHAKTYSNLQNAQPQLKDVGATDKSA